MDFVIECLRWFQDLLIDTVSSLANIFVKTWKMLEIGVAK